MSYLPQTKYGDCSQCSATETNVVKVQKDLFCLNCHRNNKNKQQLQKANLRQKVRSLSQPVKQSEAAVLNDKVEKEKWFQLIRNKLTGICQCGCGNKSQKNDDMYFRHSCCHLFPKCDFESVKYHPLNYVERAFWGGCHTNMDNQSMDRWVNMADWDDIKEKFFILAPLLTDEERASKFYTQLEKLVYNN